MPTFEDQLIVHTHSRSRILLASLSRSQQHLVTPREPIPEEDLIVLEKLYHKDYPDCGRKRGTLLRYITFFRENYEKPNHLPNLIKHIKRVANEAKP